MANSGDGLIPISSLMANPAGPAFPPIMEDSGKTSVSLDQQCAPPQSPEGVSGNYDHLFSDQMRNLRKSRGYHNKGAKAVLRTRLEATDTAARQSMKLNENAMDTSSSVQGKRDRSVAE